MANNVGPDQMPHYVASDMGLYYLPMTLFWGGFQVRMGKEQSDFGLYCLLRLNVQILRYIYIKATICR